MAVGASSVWRVRAGGNAANGAAYDATISGAGTDYSQQDAAQLSVTDAVTNGTTTVTSATGGFTTAMIGNACRITGSGVTSGYYFITGRTDTNTITVDRSPGTGTGGTLKVGGAAATIQRVLDSANSTGDKVVPGNTVYVRGSGSNNPGSADYTYSAFFTPVSGDTTSGYVSMLAENGRPRFDGSSYDLLIYRPSYFLMRGFYQKATAASVGYMAQCNTGMVIEDCAFHLNDLNIDGVTGAAGPYQINLCEFMSHASAPTLRTGKYAIKSNNYGCRFFGNTIYRMGGGGIQLAGDMSAALCNLIYATKENGIDISGSSFGSIVEGNTICSPAGHGVWLTTSAALAVSHVRNNLIANCNQASKAGLYVNSGTSTVNDKLKGGVDYNAFYNNTANYNAISASSHDVALGANPFTQSDPPTTDFSVGTGVKALGSPGAFLGILSGIATTGYMDISAAQRQESGGGTSGARLTGPSALITPGVVA